MRIRPLEKWWIEPNKVLNFLDFAGKDWLYFEPAKCGLNTKLEIKSASNCVFVATELEILNNQNLCLDQKHMEFPRRNKLCFRTGKAQGMVSGCSHNPDCPGCNPNFCRWNPQESPRLVAARLRGKHNKSDQSSLENLLLGIILVFPDPAVDQEYPLVI